MGKRKRRQRAELPLFDLPLHPEGAEVENSGPEILDEFQPLAEGPAAHELSAQVASAPGTAVQPSDSEPAEASPPEPVGRSRESVRRTKIVDPEPDPTSAAQLDLVDLAVGNGSHDTSGDPEPVESMADGREERALLGDRFLGGLADLAMQLLMLGLSIAASHGLGVVVTRADWMPFAVLALSFSFLYWTVPLAFWGQTPGMAWVGHTARTPSGQPLSFGQTLLRWLGAILTLALVGLPLLLALTGRSLSDRLSDSKTLAG